MEAGTGQGGIGCNASGRKRAASNGEKVAQLTTFHTHNCIQIKTMDGSVTKFNLNYECETLQRVQKCAMHLLQLD